GDGCPSCGEQLSALASGRPIAPTPDGGAGARDVRGPRVCRPLHVTHPRTPFIARHRAESQQTRGHAGLCSSASVAEPRAVQHSRIRRSTLRSGKALAPSRGSFNAWCPTSRGDAVTPPGVLPGRKRGSARLRRAGAIVVAGRLQAVALALAPQRRG